MRYTVCTGFPSRSVIVDHSPSFPYLSAGRMGDQLERARVRTGGQQTTLRHPWAHVSATFRSRRACATRPERPRPGRCRESGDSAAAWPCARGRRIRRRMRRGKNMRWYSGDYPECGSLIPTTSGGSPDHGSDGAVFFLLSQGLITCARPTTASCPRVLSTCSCGAERVRREKRATEKTDGMVCSWGAGGHKE